MDHWLRMGIAGRRDLIGMILCSKMDGVVTAGRIVETEAYGGVTNRASHAYGDRRADRTETSLPVRRSKPGEVWGNAEIYLG